LISDGAPPQTPLGELTALSGSLAGGRRKGGNRREGKEKKDRRLAILGSVVRSPVGPWLETHFGVF